MSKSGTAELEAIFNPRSVALAGIAMSNPGHWTRCFFNGLVGLNFDGPIYPVNPKGGELDGLKVFRSLSEIPGSVDFVISTVPAKASIRLIEECAAKGVKAVHFCTAGFRETGEEEGIGLEADLLKASRKAGIRVIGPNCIGLYCPKARLSFSPDFTGESGSVACISQSGGNATNLVREALSRGVRFSKVVSYGNACDLDESDFLEYFVGDPDTEIIAMYIEGVKDGLRFRQALARAAKSKVVVMLKGGITGGGARASAGHTGSLAGNDVTWSSLCRQLGVIRVPSLQAMADVLVTLVFMGFPRGRNVALVGGGGGASVMIADEFEKRGLPLPPTPSVLREQMRVFTPLPGNILRNPLDYSETLHESGKIIKATGIISRWEGIDLVMGFFRPAWTTMLGKGRLQEIVDGMVVEVRSNGKPLGMILEPTVFWREATEMASIIEKCVSHRLPVYFSFSSAASAIDLVLTYNERKS